MTQRILFVCTFNSIRSPLAEYILQHEAGSDTLVASAGIYNSRIDPLVVTVLDEKGIDASNHIGQCLQDIERGDGYATTIALSHHAFDVLSGIPRRFTGRLDFWDIPVPEAIMGNREQKLFAYRQTRDRLWDRIRAELLIPA